MKRCLVCVGVNQYDNANNLKTAESEAGQIYESLYPYHDEGSCHLLLSPDNRAFLATMRDALHANPDVITFYFAGHGAFQNTYHLIFRDGDPTFPAIGSTSLSDVLSMIGHAGVKHTNLVVDACYSGGSASDMHSFVNSIKEAPSGSPSLAAFLSSAGDQVSHDNGISPMIIDRLCGKVCVQTSLPYLDLLDIGRSVTNAAISNPERFPKAQNPALWGVNLSGPASAIAPNPHYDGADYIFRQSLSSIKTIVEISSDTALRELHSPALSTWDPYKGRSVILPILESIPDDMDFLFTLNGLLTSLDVAHQAKPDPFFMCSVIASLLPFTLPRLENPIVANFAADTLKNLSQRISVVQSKIIELLYEDPYCIARHGEGHVHAWSDYLDMPLRVSKILSMLSIPTICEGFCVPGVKAGHDIFDTISLFHNHYKKAMISRFDEQASHFLVLVAAALMNPTTNIAIKRMLAGYILHAPVNSETPVSRFITSPEILEAIAYGSSSIASGDALFANPSEMLFVSVVCAKILKLDAEFDLSMHRIDGSGLFAFIPENLEQFHAASIRNGINISCRIGQNVFSCQEAVDNILPHIYEVNILDAILAMLSSISYGDRAPWFLVKPMLEYGQGAPS